MKGAIDWFAHNPVAANLLMVLILTGGLMSVLSTKREVFPEINPSPLWWCPINASTDAPP